MKIVQKKPSDLIAYENNSRTHSDEQIKQIVASIKEFKFTNPILINPDNGVIAGHGRLTAAIDMGMDKVPCIVLEGLTEAQERAYVIADNNIALNSGWNYQMLELEIAELKDFDFDISVLAFDPVAFADYQGKNKEIDVESFGDEMILKITVSSSNYQPIVNALRDIGDHPETALMKALNL